MPSASTEGIHEKLAALQQLLSAQAQLIVIKSKELQAAVVNSISATSSAAVNAVSTKATALRAAVRNVEMTPTQRKTLVAAASVGVIYATYHVTSNAMRARAVRAREEALVRLGEDGQVHLFIMPRSPYAPSLSGPCTKVETFLRAARIPYVVEETVDTTGSPNECLPLMVYRGKRIADSEKIIEFLATEFRIWSDSRVSREDRAVGVAMKRAIDYSMTPFFYRAFMLENPDFAVEMVLNATSSIVQLPPFVAKLLVGRMARSLAEKQSLMALGALTFEQAEQQFLDNLAALEETLRQNENPSGFLFNACLDSRAGSKGDAVITSYDCAVYALLLPICNMMSRCSVTKPDVYRRFPALAAVLESNVLVDFVEKMTTVCFPDMKEQFEAFAAALDVEVAAPAKEEIIEDAIMEEEIIDEETAESGVVEEEEAVAVDVEAATEQIEAAIEEELSVAAEKAERIIVVGDTINMTPAEPVLPSA